MVGGYAVNCESEQVLPPTPDGVSRTSLHPQAQLSAGSTGSNPVKRGMELCNSRHRRDAITTELRQLLAFRGVDVHEAVHVSNTEALYIVLRGLLPLGS
jgi:hypothetical protein